MKIKKSQLQRIIKEELQLLNEIDYELGSTDPNAPEFSPRDPATGLRGRMKPLYRLVMKKRPDLELLDDPVEVFKQAYNHAGQTGMANVYDIIAKMEDLTQEPDPRDVRPADWADMDDVMGDHPMSESRSRWAQQSWDGMINSIGRNFIRAHTETSGEGAEFNDDQVKKFVGSLADEVIARMAKQQAGYDAHVDEFGEPDQDEMTSGGLR